MQQEDSGLVGGDCPGACALGVCFNVVDRAICREDKANGIAVKMAGLL
jgi:hypothetical protein